MSFIEVTVTAVPEYAEILIAELGELGFDTFQETEEGFQAYIEEDRFSEEAVQEVLARYSFAGEFPYQTKSIAKQNWNEEWEKNFEPLLIAGKVSVRADFHPKPEGVSYDIVITPKMSFGTGHHETTTLMIENQLTLDHSGKRVLDMGCGTGILAIMAEQLGARQVLGVDIEDWTVENARENAERNNCTTLEVRLGDAAVLHGEAPFDLILANINRNVLLEDMPVYSQFLLPGQPLVLSGFYTQDLPLLQERATELGLEFEASRDKNNWVSAIFRKTETK
ncbi:50S ribosomal protein L11 methyltransferase [Rufibacter glacialis]|uniref:Ribosomal protein L11 methyltransferase n=1 Tax=Rufibacter glacialis TaxID=1259555 RepID=A0A5M8Q7D8_9BACT|nr:50S ribosomal protein L11 methyltransferase [Rufibacter glacialis]KAA6431173.1 50S ribosomal protein L11 methyltransferase [Rufibacter glacialis]GGK84685.1 ribosomal protein L11 methyltransferase [Rufibacter glacialis]